MPGFPGRTARRIAVAAGTGVYAWWVTGLPPFSLSATVAVVGAGLVAAVLPGPPRPRNAATVAGVAVWAVLVIGLAAWQLAALVRSPRAEHPTLSSITNAALDARPVRAAAFVAWLAGAAWFGRR